VNFRDMGLPLCRTEKEQMKPPTGKSEMQLGLC
jgi:hypothetical protein